MSESNPLHLLSFDDIEIGTEYAMELNNTKYCFLAILNDENEKVLKSNKLKTINKKDFDSIQDFEKHKNIVPFCKIEDFDEVKKTIKQKYLDYSIQQFGQTKDEFIQKLYELAYNSLTDPEYGDLIQSQALAQCAKKFYPEQINTEF